LYFIDVFSPVIADNGTLLLGGNAHSQGMTEPAERTSRFQAKFFCLIAIKDLHEIAAVKADSAGVKCPVDVQNGAPWPWM
jgi:hypothetical protein